VNVRCEKSMHEGRYMGAHLNLFPTILWGSSKWHSFEGRQYNSKTLSLLDHIPYKISKFCSFRDISKCVTLWLRKFRRRRLFINFFLSNLQYCGFIK